MVPPRELPAEAVQERLRQNRHGDCDAILDYCAYKTDIGARPKSVRRPAGSVGSGVDPLWRHRGHWFRLAGRLTSLEHGLMETLGRQTPL